MLLSKEKEKTFFSRATLRKMLEQEGSARVSAEAIVTLDQTLVNFGNAIVTGALDHLRESDRKTVSIDDIHYGHEKCSGVSASMKTEDQNNDIYVHTAFIYRDTGTCLLSKSFSGLKFPDTLFTGLLMGISNMVSEVTGRTLDYLVMDDLTIHIQKYNDIYCAMICDSQQKEYVEGVLKRILAQFVDKFRDVLEKQVVSLNVFEDFYTVIEQEVLTAGMSLPTKIDVKIYRDEGMLTEKQIEDSVLVAALRNELIKASKEIKSLPIFAAEVDDNREKALEEKYNLENSDEVDTEADDLVDEQKRALRELRKSGKPE